MLGRSPGEVEGGWKVDMIKIHRIHLWHSQTIDENSIFLKRFLKTKISFTKEMKDSYTENCKVMLKINLGNWNDSLRSQASRLHTAQTAALPNVYGFNAILVTIPRAGSEGIAGAPHSWGNAGKEEQMLRPDQRRSGRSLAFNVCSNVIKLRFWTERQSSTAS